MNATNKQTAKKRTLLHIVPFYGKTLHSFLRNSLLKNWHGISSRYKVCLYNNNLTFNQTIAFLAQSFKKWNEVTNRMKNKKKQHTNYKFAIYGSSAFKKVNKI